MSGISADRRGELLTGRSVCIFRNAAGITKSKRMAL